MKQLTATTKGLISGCLMVAAQLFFLYGLKLPYNNEYQFVIFLLYFAGIAWSIADFSKSADANTKFKEYFSAGFKAFIVSTLLMVVYVAFFYISHPEIRDAQIDINKQLLIQQHTRTLPEIEANATQMKSIFMPMTLMTVTFLYLFLGAVITSLYSVIMLQKKKR